MHDARCTIHTNGASIAHSLRHTLTEPAPHTQDSEWLQDAVLGAARTARDSNQLQLFSYKEESCLTTLVATRGAHAGRPAVALPPRHLSKALVPFDVGVVYRILGGEDGSGEFYAGQAMGVDHPGGRVATHGKKCRGGKHHSPRLVRPWRDFVRKNSRDPTHVTDLDPVVGAGGLEWRGVAGEVQYRILRRGEAEDPGAFIQRVTKAEQDEIDRDGSVNACTVAGGLDRAACQKGGKKGSSSSSSTSRARPARPTNQPTNQPTRDL
jgi:hypothetical protein